MKADKPIKKVSFNKALKILLNTPNPNFVAKMAHAERKKIFKQAKIDCYKKNLFLYGFMTLVYLIGIYEEQEKYEECNLILTALKESNNNYGLDLPTKFNSRAVVYFRKAFNDLGLSGEITAFSIPFYANEIQQQIVKITL